MRIFKIKPFNRWARKVRCASKALKEAAEEVAAGKYEARLGGYLYKKRIAIAGQGKRGSLRTVVAFKKGDNLFFCYGFAKNSKEEDINDKEELALKELAKFYFSYSGKQIELAIKAGEIIEVFDE